MGDGGTELTHVVASPRKYRKPFTADIKWGIDKPTSINIELIGGNVDSDYLCSAFSFVSDVLLGNDKPVDRICTIDAVAPERVILNEPATIVLWSDGTKTVTKCKGTDDYNPLFGLMACALRKVGKNRVRIDAWEEVLAFLADSIADADECRVLSDMLAATAQLMECEGVIDELAEHDVRDDGEGACKPTSDFEVQPLFYGTDGSSRVAFVADEVTDEDRRKWEKTRATLRDLIDRGEM